MEKNYVCDGAKIMCPLCTKPKGTLKVTSNQIKVQDKFFATEGDKSKLNLMFQGNCIKSPYQSSPCQAVITPANWQNTADALIQNKKALLETSTIMCSYGGISIRIVDDLQINQPTKLMPINAPVILPVAEPKIISLEWKSNTSNKDV